MRMVTFGFSFLAALIVLDVYLQASGIQTPMETRIDPKLGPTYIPEMPISRFNEGFYLGAANRYGYMGPPVPPRRVGEERRILLLGDSFVLGHTVLPRHHFSRILQEELSDQCGVETFVLNFGKADFNFWNMYQYFHDFAGSFEHELALFFVDLGDLVPSGQIATDLYPDVELVADSLVISTGFSNTDTYRFYKRTEPFLTHSSVLRLAFNSYKMVKRGELEGVLLDKFAHRKRRPGAKPAVARVQAASPQLPALSRAILEELAKDRRNVLVIHDSIPDSLQSEIRGIGIPIIDLASSLDSLKTSGRDPNYWPVTGMYGHWNHEAHVFIGRFLAAECQRRHLI